jgi:hypothetical protein
VLVNSREMAGIIRSQKLTWWLEGEEVKTTENKIQYIGPISLKM